MARLIPRKQIEEQQNISGSLTVQQNVDVGNDVIISGSLFVSKSFFFGNNLDDRNEITGSVFLTGSLIIDGLLETAAPNTILAVTSSNTLLAVDTQRYAGILAKDFGANVPTLYVSSTDGDDTNDGRSIQYPLRTIKRAAALSQPGYDGRYGFDTGSIYNGYVIKVQAGTYLEDNPVILPKNTTIWGAGLRITKINAKNPTEDLFYVNSGCYIAEVTMGGLRLYPDQVNPEKGFAVAFQPGAFITTSPYVQNCSQISNQENSFTELYEEIPPGGGGLYVNGDVIDPDSPLASMVLDAYTQISPNGVGCLVNGRGFIQLVSFFNNFSYYAIRVNNGGHATLNNSNISFGLYGMYASGSRFISGSGGNVDARDRVRASWSVVVDVLNRGLDALPEVTTLNTAEGIRLSSPSQFPQYTTSSNVTLSTTTADEISADYKLISAIVENGTSDFPTLLAKSSNKGYSADSPYNILGATQYTSSLSASLEDLSQISSSYGVLLGIFNNGTGSFKFTSSADFGVKIGDIAVTSLGAPSYLSSSVSSSFATVVNIIGNGVNAIPPLTSSNSASIYVGNIEPFSTGLSSSLSVVNRVSASFSIIYNILANGTGSNILPIPENHRKTYTVTNVNSSSYNWDGVGNNPTIRLYRGETYKFYISASEGQGGIDYPFFIRTELYEGIEDRYDYNKGVVNNGDSVGNITFTVPYDAPNTLYYTAQINNTLSGKFDIVNNSETPFYLISNTLTYPQTISGSSESTNNIDILNAYEILTGSKAFIEEEVIQYVSSSWSTAQYDEATCRRDVGYLVNAVCQDLLYGGNNNSITAGRFYYEYPSEATTTQKDPTKTAVKYAAGLSINLVKNINFSNIGDNTYLQEKKTVADNLVANKSFIQNETITFLSSSWSNFYYNEDKCKRDVGYIVDAVATDLIYGGNERAREAGRFYYLYPSLAIVEGDGDSEGQLGQTLDGIRYAAGVATNIVKNKTFNSPASSTLAAYNLLLDNKSLIQNETIQYVNVAFPQLKYNQEKCRRDVGYIIDAIATDLLYGGNERAVTAGRYYYDYPSVATSIQKRETIGGIKYSKIIGDYIVKNIVLETPRIINNDEKNIRVTNKSNVTSQYSGSITERNSISSSFAIIEGIIKRGTSAIPSILAQNTSQNWNLGNPLNVTSDIQITSSYVTPNEVNTIDRNFNIVNSIINGGIAAETIFTSSLESLIKVTDIEQITGSSVSSNITSSISQSFAYVVEIISGGLSQLDAFVPNTSASIKATSTPQWVSVNVGTNSQTASISSSFGTIINVITNGTSVLPTLVQNTAGNIKVTTTPQFVSASYSGSLEDVSFISASISKVTQIIETGNVDLFAKQNYTSITAKAVGVYEILKNNISFIQDETIAYLSSSWSTASYDEAKCRRDVGLIVSGAAEDLLWNANSASIVNGQFYYEYPSQAQGAQLNQTLDGINYASRLAQKVIQNTVFNLPTTNISASNALLFNNKEFIQNETIAYLSSSWGGFDYNEQTCKRDVGYIIDAVRTDLVYGGNERSRIAGLYYFLYPSAATGSQLLQTTDGVKYASRIAQSIVSGSVFQLADSDKLEASRLLSLNKALIAAEVVEYVSSSWSGVLYNEDKCKRDVGYILDAVRTDLVYGGNERTSIAGEFYYKYPSSATVGGVPSSTAQLDPTTTGVEYANRLAQNIILNKVLVQPSTAVLNARQLVKEQRAFVQQNTIDYINKTYPTLNYKVDKCYRDVGFILDGVLTDLVYGGNERSITSGRFYYKYPSQATDSQATETIDGVNFAKGLSKLIAIGGKAIEDGFDLVSKIIESGSSAYPTLITNTENGIKKTNEAQYTGSVSVSNGDKLIVSSSFGNVINIIDKGLNAIPTLVSSSLRGINRTGGSQITSSIAPNFEEYSRVKNGFDIVIDIIESGTGSIPTIVNNASNLVKRTNNNQYITTASISNSYITSSKNSFDLILNIIEDGTGSLPTLVKNTNGLVKITNTQQYSSSIAISSSYFGNPINSISSSFDRIINILENGLSVAPAITSSGINNIKVTGTSQYISASSATITESNLISASISIITNIIANGTNSSVVSASLTLPTSSYSSAVSNDNRWIAYGILKNNIQFIQDETIAYLSSSWSTASYDETKCRRDIGLIISGAAEDMVFNSNSASVVNGKFYYEFPSQAQGAQLNQTLDGITYASQLAQKVIRGVQFSLPTSQSNVAYDLIKYNKEFIQNETIAYISSSWSTKEYNETTCKRDIGYILDAVATDFKWGGNERSVEAGKYYYLYPSAATGSQLKETVTGIKYAKNLVDRILRGSQFIKVSHNKLEAKELIVSNKNFIANEVIAYVSASWNGFQYNEDTCKRDVGYILDAVSTDLVYGGNERSIEAGRYYYIEPSTATTTQLGPTLSGIKHAKSITEQILNNRIFATASLSAQIVYELLLDNKQLIQNETIAFVSSSWSFFNYNEASCSRDTGYIVDAVATDILYGGNESSARAGEYYYLYPSLATVDGDGDSAGQLGQTLDGIRYARDISQKIARNIILQTPTQSEIAAHELLNRNKQFIQKETIAFLSSSWVGINNFQFNEASCSRDVAYIIDNVATDLIYGGNERSSKAGEYYYLYPSAATVTSSVSPTTDAQKGPTLDGISFAAGVAQKIISNQLLTTPTEYVQSAYSLLVQNRQFIQNETIQFIDAFYPYLIYNREKCRRDVGYIVNNVATDLWYGGNQRSVIAGDYYYRYPSKATKVDQVVETVAGVDYAKAVAKQVVQNISLSKPQRISNTDGNIKAGNVGQITLNVSANTNNISDISSSFSTVTKVIESGLTALPTFIGNGTNAIKITSEPIVSSSVSASVIEVGITTASFELIKDIIYNGSASLPDALANNFNYGFELATPTLLHISSFKQILGSGSYTSQTNNISSSFGNIINIINNGTGSIQSIVTNTSSSIKTTSATQIVPIIHGSEYQRNRISNLFGNVLNIVENGVSVIGRPTLNTSASFKVTNTEQIRLVDGVNRDLQSKIISSSFGAVIDVLLTSGTSSIAYVAPQLSANSNTKITSSYNLLINNTDLIVNETIAYMSSSWSSFYYDEAKCRRDVGLIVSGAAFDLLFGGNSASLTNGKYYYDYPSQATTTQLDQTITAIKFASGVAQKVVKGTLMYHISESAWYPQATSASYTSLIKNKGFIQSESIAYVSSSWQGFEYNEASCSRDIGYIIDAVATDLLYGGNERSIVAGRYYYDYPSQATSAQLEPTLTGVRYAKGLSMRVISGSVLTNADAATQYSYNLLKTNKTFIQEETLAFVNAKWPDLDYAESKCKRDVGYIVDAVSTDLLYGGNERSNKAGEFYYLYPSLATGVQKDETTIAMDYARRLAQSVINSVYINEPQPISNTANNIKVTSVPQINGTAATQTQVTAVSASIGIIVDILQNGTGSLPTSIPYVTPSTDPNVINAYNNLKQNIPFIAAETVAYISSSWVTGSNSDLAFVYNDLSCSRDVGLIISGAAEDLLWNSNSASIVNGKFYYEYPSQATGSQLDETLDGIKYASELAQKIVLNTLFVTASAHASASHALMKQNKGFIQAEVLSYITSSWNEFTYSLDKCRRDVGLIIDAVSTDVLYGGNERSAKAGTYYYVYASNATGTQKEQTVNAINFAKDVAVNVIKNTHFVTASQSVSASVALLRNNRGFIQEETMQYLTASWSTFNYDKDKCRRDVGYIIDGVATDLLYGGNERTYMSADFYFKYPSKATLLGDGDGDGQLKQTVDGINYASRIAQKVVQNIQFQTSSIAVSASFDLLRRNKEFIQAETIAYVSSSWSNVYYNEASCSRDVGYLIDAAATDLLYGGTERAVTAGTFYYAFPSRATQAGVPSEANQLDPTITGVRYAGRLSKKVVENPTFTNIYAVSESLMRTVDLLKFNKSLIQKETITFLSSSWSTLKYNEVSCSRDLGFIIDAIRTDLVYGGNERSIEAGSYYYKIPSVAIYESYTDNGQIGQKKQTVDGINFARGISEKVVTNTLLTYLAPSTKRRQAAVRLVAAKEELKQRAIGYTNGAFPYLVYNEASCSRDTGLIVDACATDLLYGGNERAIAAASSYYNGQYGSAQAVVSSQKLETLETNRYLRTRAEFVAAGAPLESFGSLIVATGIDYSYNGSGVTFKALPPNQGGSGVADPAYEITELGGGRIFFTSGNQDGDFRIGTGLSINQATGTLVGRTFSKSLFSLVTPFSLALQI